MRQSGDPAEYMEFDPERNVVAAQPFFRRFVHEAVAIAGSRGLIPDLCLDWWPLVEDGADTLPELWEVQPGETSRAHAWSATPTHDLTAHVLGVRPLGVGWKRARIDPCFGELERVSGAVPTPHGFIEADFDRQGGAVVVPDGVTAVVGPERMELGPGRHRVSLSAYRKERA